MILLQCFVKWNSFIGFKLRLLEMVLHVLLLDPHENQPSVFQTLYIHICI